MTASSTRLHCALKTSPGARGLINMAPVEGGCARSHDDAHRRGDDDLPARRLSCSSAWASRPESLRMPATGPGLRLRTVMRLGHDPSNELVDNLGFMECRPSVPDHIDREERVDRVALPGGWTPSTGSPQSVRRSSSSGKGGRAPRVTNVNGAGVTGDNHLASPVRLRRSPSLRRRGGGRRGMRVHRRRRTIPLR